MLIIYFFSKFFDSDMENSFFLAPTEARKTYSLQNLNWLAGILW